PCAKERVRTCYRVLEAALKRRTSLAPVSVFCPIWAKPLMTIHGDTYISDALDLAGAHNVFSDRPRRYPLAADSGRALPLLSMEVGDRDTRYPRITEEEVKARAPQVILLPDEPHPFSQEEAAHFATLSSRVVHIAGKDICWYGAWSAEGIPRLGETLAK